jgi:alginate O-acetyltransferase complex protein AlgJ
MNTPTIPSEFAPVAALESQPVQRMPVPHALAGACFVLVLVLGLLSNGYGWLNDKLKLANPSPNWQDVMTGTPMQQLADAMANTPMPQNAAKLERAFSWLVAGDLGARVRQGQQDWLFLADEFTPHSNAKASAASRAAEVIALRKRLVAQGIELLVVVVPDKSRIADAHLGTLHRPQEFAERIAQWTTTLAKAGVDVVDLSELLGQLQQRGEAAYLRTDSHWTEAGAAAAALQVAQRARALGVVVSNGSGLQMTGRETRLRPGDLVRLAGIDSLPLALQPKPESTQQSRFEAGQFGIGAKPAAAKNDDDLFGDGDLPTVAVIGSSFSRTSNFVPFLAESLKAQVANFALDGGDFAGAAQAYFASAAFKQTPPKLLIWEIPERVLQADRHNDHVR